MTLGMLRTGKPFLFCRTICQIASVNHMATITNSSHFEDKCKKIGAVVTRTGAESSRSPVVAILGWNSAQDKHLAKYSEIFEQKGFDTIRIPANPYNTFLRLNRIKEISLELLEILEEMNANQNRAFILYAFSMGGFNVNHFIRQAISIPGQRHFKSINIIGCIFDSCPHFPGWQSLKGIQSTILDTIPNPLIKAVVWVGLGLVCPPVYLFSSELKLLIPDSMSNPFGSPELFLFCSTDPLVPDKDVWVFIETHKKKGVEVFTKCWEVSGHVQHYRNYPAEYLNQVNNFTDYCMKQYFTSRTSKL